MACASIRHPLSLAALIALVAALLLVPAAAGASTPVTERTATSAAAVRDYWSQARMRAAEPIEAPVTELPPEGDPLTRVPTTAGASYVPAGGADPRILAGSPSKASDAVRGILPGSTREEILDPAEPDFRSHGRVFFTIATGAKAGDYVCSATAVNSRNRSLVWTAGHCVFPEGGGEFAANWVFVPAYHEGSAPFGEWPAKRLATTGPWEAAANIKYDLGAAVVRTSPTAGKLQNVIGARGIGFDQPREHTYQAYGYPAVQPPLEFTGEREFRCTSPLGGNDEPGTTGPPTMSIGCDMTGGSSGGAWIAGTILLSVTSYGYPLELNGLYGPYMSSSAKALYKGVRGKVQKPKPAGQKGPKSSKR